MWTERDNRLVREFRFKDFQEAFTFMTRVAFWQKLTVIIRLLGNTFSYVRIELHTHDAGGMVTRRTVLAQEIDSLVVNHPRLSSRHPRQKKAPTGAFHVYVNDGQSLESRSLDGQDLLATRDVALDRLFV